MKTNILFKGAFIALLQVLLVSVAFAEDFKKAQFSPESTDPELVVFPNPTSSRYSINLPVGSLRDPSSNQGNQDAIIEVINMYAHVIFMETVSLTSDFLAREYSFNPTDEEGIYSVKVTIGNRVFTRQLIYQR